MNIHLIAVGARMPDWVKQAYDDYAKRLSTEIRLYLHEVKTEKRHRNLTSDQVRSREKDRILALVPDDAILVVLDVQGKIWATEDLAEKMSDWMVQGRSIALVIGGPDGVDEQLLQRADRVWSLSHLTFPHPLVRVILVEQIYRSWSIIKNHPYHRGG